MEKQVLNSFKFLSIIESVNIVFPFLLYPILTDVLGSSIFADILYGYAIAAFFKIFIDFGTQQLGPRMVAICRDNNSELSTLVSSIFYFRVASVTVSVMILGMLYVCNFLTPTQFLIALTIISQLFFHRYFWHGLSEINRFTYPAVIAKLFALSIFFFFQFSSVSWVIIILLAIEIVPALFLFRLMLKRVSISWVPQDRLIEYYNAFKPMFLSRIVNSLKDKGNYVFIVSSLAPSEIIFYMQRHLDGENYVYFDKEDTAFLRTIQ